MAQIGLKCFLRKQQIYLCENALRRWVALYRGRTSRLGYTGELAMSSGFNIVMQFADVRCRSDLLHLELLREHKWQTFDRLDAVYKERLMVILQKWLRAKSVQSKGPLRGFRRLDEQFHTHYEIVDKYH